MRYGEVVRKALFVQDRDGQEMNAVLGIGGEAGEIVDHYKKLLFHPGAKGNDPALLLELGDLLFYLSLLTEVKFGVSLLEVAKANIVKLKARWPENYGDVDLESLTL